MAAAVPLWHGHNRILLFSPSAAGYSPLRKIPGLGDVASFLERYHHKEVKKMQKELSTATGMREVRWPMGPQMAVQAVEEEYAWRACEYAGTLLQCKDPTNTMKARTLLDEALAIARELGMLALIERVEHLHSSKESVQQEQPTYPAGLSQREVAVLRLIGLGKSNREIAAELVISVHTANCHVSHILSKMGAANQAEAAVYAARHGLF
jgi:DNA-binding CsgD family transcriptional regulator